MVSATMEAMMATMEEATVISTATVMLVTVVVLSARASLTMDVLPMCTEASMESMASVD